MALFNKTNTRKSRAINRAGGEAFVQKEKLQLASLLLTSFAQNQFYRDQNQTFGELTKLLAKVSPFFAAKAAIYARTEFGMRSITHVLAAELAAYASGETWAKGFYDRIVYRPDDMLEIMAYFYAKGGKTLPNAMKKGFSKSFDRFDAYQLAKYRGERKDVKLIDAVNLLHPTPTAKNAEALKALVAGDLQSKNTWETKLTKAGQVAENQTDKAARKAEAWADLISSRRLGYFALLRNLRNIAEQAPHLIDEAVAILTDELLVRKSKVLPFRYVAAMDAVQNLEEEGATVVLKNALQKVFGSEKAIPSNTIVRRKLMHALNRALDISLANVPRFEGRTLVVLDDSGSMTWSKGKDGKTPIQIGALFAAALYKSNDADLMRFSDNAAYLSPNVGDATMSIADRLVKSASSGGTNFHSIFNTAKVAYDRIIILSDMQGWIGQYAPTQAFAKYQKAYKVNPYIYSFDLSGYGSLQFPEARVFALAGFSEKVFDLMQMLEKDRNALVHAIESIEL